MGEVGGSFFFILNLVKGVLKRIIGERVVFLVVGGILGWCMIYV